QRHGHALSLMVIDIDDFKRYNDHFGHRLGDECLKTVAAALDRTLRRPGDFVGRYGGEEFVATLSHVNLADGLRVGEMLRAAVESIGIEAPPGVSGPVVTISIGVAELKDDDVDPKALFDRADASMYQAKHSGKNQVAAVDATGQTQTA
ncbi:MAG TPA: GGDEF domain-containing protein, partial [Wenzhouxiangella sp.]|nr:GGDEF domain-containing protein [Wenzhouxiangella sp.]